ncbi:bleomycin resistance protein [Mycetocola zhujimingii]|uniref:bleomycin resistance protein n=1 Tax=Mycetocola zhujimingii TaxID=2079792 RepID=UPI000D36CED4|nr:VOC family protein [Mycetocola zhujimingii]AWB87731.1 bleomycin resistance family protein [Mycetocola zhujimingii]
MPQHSDVAPPSLVPELLITDLTTSLRFWVDLCGFEILYDRPEEGFAYLHLGSAHVMLDQIGLGRDWVTGTLERPLGRGVNFEIAVPSLDEILARCAAAKWPLFLQPETRWYRTADGDIGVQQFLVQDPDGYLLRFTSRVASTTA